MRISCISSTLLKQFIVCSCELTNGRTFLHTNIVSVSVSVRRNIFIIHSLSNEQIKKKSCNSLRHEYRRKFGNFGASMMGGGTLLFALSLSQHTHTHIYTRRYIYTQVHILTDKFDCMHTQEKWVSHPSYSEFTISVFCDSFYFQVFHDNEG